MGLRSLYAERAIFANRFKLTVWLDTADEVITALSAVKAALEKE